MDAGGDLDAWELWWEHNREAFLWLDRGKRFPKTEGGAEEPTQAFAQRRAISEHSLRTKVVPELFEVLAEDDDALTSAALLSLARVGDVRSADVAAALVEHLDHANHRVSESACIGLGVLARPQDLPTLKALLADDGHGRSIYGRSEVSWRMRSFAAYSLGLAAQRSENPDVRRFAVHALLANLERREKCATDEPRVATMIALGMVAPGSRGDADGPPSASNTALAERVLRILGDRRESDEIRAHAPAVLASVYPDLPFELRDDVAQTLVETVFKRSKTDDRIRQGCVIAIGKVADADEDELDARMREVLQQLALNDKRPMRGISLVALAQAASRPGNEGDALAAADETRAFLNQRLARAKSHERSWAALAYGVFAHGLAEAGAPLDADQTAALRFVKGHARSPEQSAAAAIGVGLARDTKGVVLLAELEGKNDDAYAAHEAWALGLCGSPDGVAPLRDLMHEADHRPAVLEASALGLALLHDTEVVPTLQKMLESCDCLTTKGGVALALGRVGGEKALDPLLAMLGDEKNTDLERSYAVVGLGRLADRDVRPWPSRISIGLNYRASSSTLRGNAGILDLP